MLSKKWGFTSTEEVIQMRHIVYIAIAFGFSDFLHCLCKGEVWRGGKVASTSWRCKSWLRKPRREYWLQTGTCISLYIIIQYGTYLLFLKRNDSELEHVVLLNKQRVCFSFWGVIFLGISQMKSLKKSHSWNPDCKRWKSWGKSMEMDHVKLVLLVKPWSQRASCPRSILMWLHCSWASSYGVSAIYL